MITFPLEFVERILAGEITVVAKPRHRNSPNLFSFQIAKAYGGTTRKSFAGIRILDKYQSRVEDIPESIIIRSGYKTGEMEKYRKHLKQRLKIEDHDAFMKAVVVIFLFEVEGSMGVYTSSANPTYIKEIPYSDQKEIDSYAGTKVYLKPIPLHENRFISSGIRDVDIGEMRGRPYIVIEDES